MGTLKAVLRNPTISRSKRWRRQGLLESFLDMKILLWHWSVSVLLCLPYLGDKWTCFPNFYNMGQLDVQRFYTIVSFCQLHQSFRTFYQSLSNVHTQIVFILLIAHIFLYINPDVMHSREHLVIMNAVILIKLFLV